MDDFYYLDNDGFYIDDVYDYELDYEYDELGGQVIEGEFIIEEVEPDMSADFAQGYVEGHAGRVGARIDPLIYVALLMALFVVFNLLRDQGNAHAIVAQKGESGSEGELVQTASHDEMLGNPEVVTSPYEHHILTQGPHGFSYGHMAIDISAGEGAEIKSPIEGEVTGLYVDELGNTVIEIENRYYKVTMLHGLYSVGVGDRIQLGQQVGVESNQGNTYDMAGRSCRGRNCGYHTHLNIFDKRLGSNVNPLDLMEAP